MEITSTIAPPNVARSPLTFEEIYATYFNLVARWVRALGGPEAEHDDILQEIFIVVFRRLPDFDGESLSGWLYQITRRRVRDVRRLVWFRLLFSKTGSAAGLPATDIDFEAAIDAKDSTSLLSRLLSGLPEGQRAAFVFFEIEGYSGEEIAALQGVPINTVWARVYKARKKLTDQLRRVQKRKRSVDSEPRSAPPARELRARGGEGRGGRREPSAEV